MRQAAFHRSAREVMNGESEGKTKKGKRKHDPRRFPYVGTRTSFPASWVQPKSIVGALRRLVSRLSRPQTGVFATNSVSSTILLSLMRARVGQCTRSNTFEPRNDELVLLYNNCKEPHDPRTRCLLLLFPCLLISASRDLPLFQPRPFSQSARGCLDCQTASCRLQPDFSLCPCKRIA